MRVLTDDVQLWLIGALSLGITFFLAPSPILAQELDPIDLEPVTEEASASEEAEAEPEAERPLEAEPPLVETDVVSEDAASPAEESEEVAEDSPDGEDREEGEGEEEEDGLVYNELLIIVGAEGEAEYGQIFAENEALWSSAAAQGKVKLTTIGAEDEASLKSLETYLAEAPKDLAMPLWIVLIGHGTYDKRKAFFNLAGPDLGADTFKEWLEPFTRPLIILNTASSSGAFLPILSKKNRIVVTATKSGTEVNYASFGSYLAGALLEPEADFNNDGENSIFELYQYAARQTADFYEQEGRIQTETPLIDDNGDGRGTSLEALAAIREGGKASREPDGSYAKRWALVLSPAEQALPPEMRQKRNVLESQIDALRRRQNDLGEDTYYDRLEKLVVQIAELYDALDLPLPEEVEAEETTKAGATPGPIPTSPVPAEVEVKVKVDVEPEDLAPTPPRVELPSELLPGGDGREGEVRPGSGLVPDELEIGTETPTTEETGAEADSEDEADDGDGSSS